MIAVEKLYETFNKNELDCISISDKELNPNNKSAYIAIGNVHYMQKDYERGLS